MASFKGLWSYVIVIMLLKVKSVFTIKYNGFPCGGCECLPARVMCEGPDIIGYPKLSQSYKIDVSSIYISGTHIMKLPSINKVNYPVLCEAYLFRNPFISCSMIHDWSQMREDVKVVSDCPQPTSYSSIPSMRENISLITMDPAVTDKTQAPDTADTSTIESLITSDAQASTSQRWVRSWTTSEYISSTHFESVTDASESSNNIGIYISSALLIGIVIIGITFIFFCLCKKKPCQTPQTEIFGNEVNNSFGMWNYDEDERNNESCV